MSSNLHVAQIDANETQITQGMSNDLSDLLNERPALSLCVFVAHTGNVFQARRQKHCVCAVLVARSAHPPQSLYKPPLATSCRAAERSEEKSLVIVGTCYGNRSAFGWATKVPREQPKC